MGHRDQLTGQEIIRSSWSLLSASIKAISLGVDGLYCVGVILLACLLGATQEMFGFTHMGYYCDRYKMSQFREKWLLGQDSVECV